MLDRAALAILAAVVVGFVLRAWGHRFGLPFLYHEDEAVIVDRALRMPIDGPNPYWFAYPTLALYVQAVVSLAVFAGQWITGSARSYAEFAAACALDPTSVYAAGRLVTAAMGAATIAVVAAAARRLASLESADATAAAIAAAVLVALDALHVEHSHYITTDVPLALAGAMVILATARIAVVKDGGSWRQYATAGAFVGIAAAIKYPGALFALQIVFVYLQVVDLRDWRTRLVDTRLPVAALASVVAFVACSPFVVLNYRGFLRDFAVEAAHMRAGHLGFETAGNHYVTLLGGLTDYADTGLVLFFVIGAVAFVFTRDVLGRALVATVVVMFVLAGMSNVLFTRYMLPLIPAAAIVAARGMVATATLAARSSHRARATVVATIVVTTVALPCYLIAHRLRLFTSTDTRTRARVWVDETFAGAARPRFAVEWKSIPTGPRPITDVDVVPVDYDLDRMVGAGVRYVAISDRMYRRYLKAPGVYGAQIRFYRDLLDRGLVVNVFTPFDSDAGQLVSAPDGAPMIVRGAAGRPWEVMPLRSADGPVIQVFDLGPTQAPTNAAPPMPDQTGSPAMPDDAASEERSE